MLFNADFLRIILSKLFHAAPFKTLEKGIIL